MKKRCCRCGKIKPLNKFNKKGLLKSGKIKFQPLCKICNSINCKKYYRENKEHHLKVIYKNKVKYRAVKKTFLNHIKEINGCALCNEKEICCLDFHHLHNKKFLLSRNEITCIKKIKEELKKCVCLCSNCHRKVHNNLLFVCKKHICKIKYLMF